MISLLLTKWNITLSKKLWIRFHFIMHKSLHTVLRYVSPPFHVCPISMHNACIVHILVLVLFKFVVLDAGSTLGSTNIVSEMLMLYTLQSQMLISTCAAECMRDHLHECTEFVADLHTLTKIKAGFLNRETFEKDVCIIIRIHDCPILWILWIPLTYKWTSTMNHEALWIVIHLKYMYKQIHKIMSLQKLL